jgi:hypothetical protein
MRKPGVYLRDYNHGFFEDERREISRERGGR